MNKQSWSVPETDVWSSIGEALEEDGDSVLASIISVEGSAYRRPGAKMVISPGGEGVGSITAGCLEDEVIELAGRVRSESKARIETYDLIADNDVWGLGLGCNGIIEVLLEPLRESLRQAVDALERGDSLVAVTVLEREEAPTGQRLYYDRDRGWSGDTSNLAASLLEELEPRAVDALEQGRSHALEIQAPEEKTSTRFFLDTIAPPPRLVILGSGHDVEPVVELTRLNDFQVTVVGFRGADNLEELFPRANRVRSSSPAQLREHCEFDRNTYVVVMTHNYVDDRLAVQELVQTPIPYLGLMGPRERFEQIMGDLDDTARTRLEENLDRIYTPIGLNLGGGSPYQIATSIAAELLAVHHGREPRHLKDHEGPIHSRSPSAASPETTTGV